MVGNPSTRTIPRAGWEARVHPAAASLSQDAVGEFLTAAADAIARRGRFNVALAGGRTPRSVHEQLAGMAEGRLDWGRIHVFFGDERCVPPAHPDSNFRMASETLLSRVPIPPANIHRICAELEPATAASTYEEELRTAVRPESLPPAESVSAESPDAVLFTESASRPPSLDLVFLGMGADGHTASLFPGTAALLETRRWVVANRVPQLGVDRITLTFPVLNVARRVVFLVTGADKAGVLAEVFAGGDRSPRHPVEWVRPIRGSVVWLMDAAAAQRLPFPPASA